MMLQNSDAYVNGSTGTVTYLGEDYVCVSLNDDNHTEVTVREACWEVTTYEKDSKGSIRLVVIGRYYQLPLRLAYAVTVHRSQGQTLQKAVLCIGKSGSEIFSCGQLYVGISRITDLGNLYIKGALDSVTHLTSNEVLEYYKSVGIEVATVPAESNHALPAMEPEKTKKKSRIRKKRENKTSETRTRSRKTIQSAQTEKEKPAGQAGRDEIAIAVPISLQPIILAFAVVLDPAAHTDGSTVYIASGVASSVNDFIKNF